MKYTRGFISTTQDLRPLPDPKMIGPGPMPLLFVPFVMLLHVLALSAITWGVLQFFVFRKTSEVFAAKQAQNISAAAEGGNVERDLKANDDAKSYCLQQEQMLAECRPFAMFLPDIIASFPADQKVIRVALRRAEDSRETNEFLLRVELVNDGPVAPAVLEQVQSNLAARGFTGYNFATRADLRRSYIEGRVIQLKKKGTT